MNFYHLYGALLQSDIEFPELEATSPKKKSSPILVSFFRHNFRSPFRKNGTESKIIRYWFNPAGEEVVIDASHAGAFRVHFKKRTIEWKPCDEERLDLARVIVKGIAMGLLLSHSPSFLLLHAAAIGHKGKAILLLGCQGQGKSTLAAFLSNRGSSLLSDDIAVLRLERDCCVVQAGPPEIRLWPRTISLLKMDGKKKEMIYVETLKQRVVIEEGALKKAAPVDAIYILNRTKKARIRIDTLQGREAILRVLENCYMKTIKDPGALSQQLKLTAELTKRLPIKRLNYPSGFLHLPRIRQALLRDSG